MTVMTSTKPLTEPLPAQFRLVDATIKRRLILSVEGDWGSGKTDLALTAPGPIAFFKFDLNSDDTLAKYAHKKKIYRLEYEVPDSGAPDAQAQAEKLMQAFIRDYHIAVANREIRSMVWDTASEVWEQMRLAHFGKLTNVMPHHYVQINNLFRRLIRTAFESDTNLILVHRLKDEWMNVPDGKGGEKGKKTGRKERAGFSDIGFACQVMVRTVFDTEEHRFSAQVLKCTQNPMITGNSYTEVGDLRMNAFPFIAADVFTGSTLEEWE